MGAFDQPVRVTLTLLPAASVWGAAGEGETLKYGKPLGYGTQGDPPSAAAAFDQMPRNRYAPSLHQGEKLQMSPTSPTQGAYV